MFALGNEGELLQRIRCIGSQFDGIERAIHRQRKPFVSLFQSRLGRYRKKIDSQGSPSSISTANHLLPALHRLLT